MDSQHSGKNVNYTQFCISVERGDDNMVKDMIVKYGKDLNTNVVYSVDGTNTTPVRSALAKADIPMVLALLTSKVTKVHLSDLEKAAAPVNKDQVTPVLLKRIVDALEPDAKQKLLERPVEEKSSRTRKVALVDEVVKFMKNVPDEVKVRCPPEEALRQESEEEDLDEEEDEEMDEETEYEESDSGEEEETEEEEVDE